MILFLWVNIKLICYDIAVREVDTISLSDVEEAGAWKIGDFAHFSCHVFWDVADMMSVRSEYLDGIWVIIVGRFCLKGTNKLSKVAVKVATILNACYIKSYHIKMVVVLWPYRNMVAFVLNTKILQFLDWRI